MENLIKDYLNKHMVGQAEFARKVKMSRQLLHYHIKNPGARWNPDDAINIERATLKEITAHGLVFRK